jgi:hypothetical protein
MMLKNATSSSHLFLVTGLAIGLASCSTSSGSGGGQTVIRPNQGPSPATSGISPDKEAEVQLVLQQREVSTRKCYQDVLNEKADRNFQGTVKVLIALGTSRQATDVRVVGGTLNDQDVQSCLVSTIKRFEFPELTQPGEVQSEFRFQPAY